MANNNTPKSVYPLASDQGNPIPLDVVMPQWSSIVPLAAGAKLELTLPESLNIISVHSDKVVRLTNGTSSVVPPDPGNGGGTSPGDDPDKPEGYELIYTKKPTALTGDDYYFQEIDTGTVVPTNGKLVLTVNDGYSWVLYINILKQFQKSAIGPGSLKVVLTGTWASVPDKDMTGGVDFNTDTAGVQLVPGNSLPANRASYEVTLAKEFTSGLDNLQVYFRGDNYLTNHDFTLDEVKLYYKPDTSQGGGDPDLEAGYTLLYTESPTNNSGADYYFNPISQDAVVETGDKIKLSLTSGNAWVGILNLINHFHDSTMGPGFLRIVLRGSWDVKPTANTTGVVQFGDSGLDPVIITASEIQDKLIITSVLPKEFTGGWDNIQYAFMGDSNWPNSVFTLDTIKVYYKYDSSQDNGSGGGGAGNWVPLYEKYDLSSLNDYSNYGVYDIKARTNGEVSINAAGRPQAKWSGDNALWQVDVTLNQSITLPNNNKIRLIMGGGFGGTDVSQTPLEASMVIPSSNDQLAILTGGPDSSSKDPQVVFTGTMNHDATFDNFRLYMGSNYPVPESYQTITSIIVQYEQTSGVGALNTDATKVPGAIATNTFIVIEHTLYELAVGNKLTVENISDEGAVVLINGLVRWTQARNRQYGVS